MSGRFFRIRESRARGSENQGRRLGKSLRPGRGRGTTAGGRFVNREVFLARIRQPEREMFFSHTPGRSDSPWHTGAIYHGKRLGLRFRMTGKRDGAAGNDFQSRFFQACRQIVPPECRWEPPPYPRLRNDPRSACGNQEHRDPDPSDKKLLGVVGRRDPADGPGPFLGEIPPEIGGGIVQDRERFPICLPSRWEKPTEQAGNRPHVAKNRGAETAAGPPGIHQIHPRAIREPGIF